MRHRHITAWHGLPGTPHGGGGPILKTIGRTRHPGKKLWVASGLCLRAWVINNVKPTSLEPGSEKVVIFVDNEGLPTHAARQLTDGSWTSKLGSWQDNQHQHLQALAGTASIYGVVALIMRPPR